MKAFIAAVVVVVISGVAAAYVLGGVQETVAQAYSTDSVRVGEPGENLVEWR